MSIAEAEELIISKEGKVCLRLYRRTDGTLLTRDCPEGLKTERMKQVGKAAGLCALASAFFAIFRPDAVQSVLAQFLPLQPRLSYTRGYIQGQIAVPKARVVVTARYIPYGQWMDVYDLEVRDVEASKTPVDAYNSPAAVVRTYASANLSKGTILTTHNTSAHPFPGGAPQPPHRTR